MDSDNINTFSENIALYINGRFPELTYNSIKNGIRSKGKRIIPILYKTNEDFPAVKLGVKLSDELYIVNAKPLNSKTKNLTDYADSIKKSFKIIDNLKEIL
jgi:hypothetical protein